MSDEPFLDLSDNEHADSFAGIVDVITDILMEMSEGYSLPEQERLSTEMAMQEVAIMILGELDLVINAVNDDGTVTATLRPSGIET